MILEIVKDFDNSYYCNLNGIDEYISLKELKEQLKRKYNIVIKSLKDNFIKTKFGRKTYYINEF